MREDPLPNKTKNREQNPKAESPTSAKFLSVKGESDTQKVFFMGFSQDEPIHMTLGRFFSLIYIPFPLILLQTFQY